MRKSIFLAVVCLIVVESMVACGGGGAEDYTSNGNNNTWNTTGTNYFPMTAGSKWSYLVTKSSGTTHDETLEIISSSTATTVIKTTYSNSGQYDIDSLVKLSDRAWGFSSYTSYDANNNVTYSWEPTPPLLYLPSTWTVGTHETQPATSTNGTNSTDITVEGLESVTIPAGSFSAMTISEVNSWVTGSATVTRWFVDGIGEVKTITTSTDTIEGPYETTRELTSYSIQ